MVQLFADVVPKTVENFQALCTDAYNLIVIAVPERKKLFTASQALMERVFIVASLLMRISNWIMIALDFSLWQIAVLTPMSPIFQGMDVLKKIGQVGTSNGQPAQVMKIVDCGEVADSKSQPAVGSEKVKGRRVVLPQALADPGKRRNQGKLLGLMIVLMAKLEKDAKDLLKIGGGRGGETLHLNHTAALRLIVVLIPLPHSDSFPDSDLESDLSSYESSPSSDGRHQKRKRSSRSEKIQHTQKRRDRHRVRRGQNNVKSRRKSKWSSSKSGSESETSSSSRSSSGDDRSEETDSAHKTKKPSGAGNKQSWYCACYSPTVNLLVASAIRWFFKPNQTEALFH
ncbi:hypothetical protein Ancab_020157 [Ancistrocladus abbreviatus]